MEVQIVQRVLKMNDELAAEVRQLLEAHDVTAVNMMSAPGSGKTSLLERTIQALGEAHDSTPLRIGVIEGDPDTSLDAERIQPLGVPVVQINTSGSCHLEANLVKRALASLPLDDLDVVIVENVGNMVCPVSFDLGESARVAVLSVTEGDDKPAKYAGIFRTANAVILNKVDLLPYVDFDLDRFKTFLGRVNDHAPLFMMSCKTGEGLEMWLSWLRGHLAEIRRS